MNSVLVSLLFRVDTLLGTSVVLVDHVSGTPCVLTGSLSDPPKYLDRGFPVDPARSRKPKIRFSKYTSDLLKFVSSLKCPNRRNFHVTLEGTSPVSRPESTSPGLGTTPTPNNGRGP